MAAVSPTKVIHAGRWLGPQLKTVAIIKQTVAEAYGLSQGAIFSKRRGGDSFSWPRQIAMDLCRQYTELNLKQIGKCFNRGHDTVINSRKIVSNRIATEPRTWARIEAMHATIRIKLKIKKS